MLNLRVLGLVEPPTRPDASGLRRRGRASDGERRGPPVGPAEHPHHPHRRPEHRRALSHAEDHGLVPRRQHGLRPGLRHDPSSLPVALDDLQWPVHPQSRKHLERPSIQPRPVCDIPEVSAGRRLHDRPRRQVPHQMAEHDEPSPLRPLHDHVGRLLRPLRPLERRGLQEPGCLLDDLPDAEGARGHRRLWRSIRTKAYQYIETYDKSGNVAFREYRPRKDPWQNQNLLADGNSANDPDVAALRAKIARYAKCVGALCP